VPYCLPELIKASLATIYFCEGEKDADALIRLGLTATTASEGARAPWDDALTPHFKDRHVVILPDADEPGRKHAQKVARAINGVAQSLRILDLYPDRNDGSDVANWLEADTAGVKLSLLAKQAPLWEPSPDDGKGDASASDDDQLVAELAALPQLQYERRREAAAEKLGVRVSVLDKLVAAARKDEDEDTQEPSPVLYAHWNVEPSDEPVDGDILLRAITETLRHHVIMTNDQAVVVALWVVLTWLHEQIAVHSPVLSVTSPLPNSGKTTLLKLISFLVRNGLSSVSITGAALFRSIAKWAPTISIDEADTAFVNNDDLKDVVNSGWTRGDCIIRCDPDTHDPRPYSTFCPKAIGMIGRKLPPATLSRCLMIAMRRKRPSEHADDFEHIDSEHLARLRSQLLRWAIDNAEALAKAAPEILPGLHNRARMNWRTLLVIAEAAGGDWKRAAWKAVRAIEEVNAAADPELGVQLLSDIRDAFDRRGTDRMMTKTLLEELAKDTEGPWAAFGKKGQPITDRQLSRLLKDFRQGHGIKSRNMRLEGIAGPGKGYLRTDFEDDFASYLFDAAAKTPSQTATPLQINVFNDLEQKMIATSGPDGSVENGLNPLEQTIVAV
jgi:5S rRNA maturation endonuclease (ribonuclease M5)